MSILRTFAGLAAVAVLVGGSSLAQAQYMGTWQPTGEANWTNSANWLDYNNNPGVPTQPTDGSLDLKRRNRRCEHGDGRRRGTCRGARGGQY